MKKLIFVTSDYPFGSGETFIENEIDYLADNFDKVFIFSANTCNNEVVRNVPKNVTFFAANPKQITKADYFLNLPKPPVMKEIFKNCFGKNALSKISACCYSYARVSSSLKRADEFLKICDIRAEDEITVYSYWLDTIGMCALKIAEKIKKSGVNPKIIARCHGFDVYSERSYVNYLPFQEHQIERFEMIYPCSKNGERYLKDRYPQFAHRISCSYLGVKDYFGGNIPKRNEIFNIVSCSNVIPLKRINLIADALSHITDKKICWTHFGDGSELEKVKSLAQNCLPDNITAVFAGRKPNDEIYDFYKNNDVNLFINVSASEGLPVSIMEAISFGIPVIATNVGGTSEIVKNGENGFLLKEAFDLSVLADSVIKFTQMPESKYNSFCESARNTYLSNFNSEKNYSEFSKNL